VLVVNGVAAGDRAQLVVVTAPGQDGGLRWDTAKCSHGEGVGCSGQLGCVVAGADEWNKTAPARWSQLHRAAAARVRRKVGRFRIVERAWEPQKRGVLHQNVVVRASSAREMAAAKLYVEALTELAPQYGFGFVSQKRDVREAAHAARYIAKYVSKSADGVKLGIGDVAMRDDCPRIIAWVDPQLSQATGETIRACRERRTVWRLASRVAAVRPAEGCSLEEAATIRATHRAGKLFHELHARARRARAMGDGWNEQLERRQAIEEADARWVHLHLAKLGLEPELVA
jgi:hypothetical protein